MASEREVQAALEKVSQNRTTIVIAHRLSTIKRADNILVMAKGEIVQQGTHESLLADETGTYWRLVHAQQLALSTQEPENEEPENEKPKNEEPGKDDVIEEEKILHQNENNKDDGKEQRLTEKESYSPLYEPEATLFDEGEPMLAKEKPVSRSKSMTFLTLLLEQKRNAIFYLIILIAAVGAACKFPICFFMAEANRPVASHPSQAYLFARLISSFSYQGESLRTSDNFLCLLLLCVAVIVGTSYFTLGWVTNVVSIVSSSSKNATIHSHRILAHDIDI